MTPGRYVQRQFLEATRDCSSLGSASFIVLVCAVMAPVDPATAFRLMLGLALVEVAGNSLKFVVHRERPDRQAYGNTLERLDAGSFPSIHTARAAMVAAVGGLSSGWMLLWVVVSVLVAASRIILGRHYVSDVLAGGLLGLVAGSLIG